MAFAKNKLSSVPQNRWLAKLTTDHKWFWAAVGLGVVLLIGLLFWIRATLNVVAVVGDQKITKADVADMAPRLQKFYEYNEDTEALADIQKTTLNYLVEDKIIRVEAQKQGITADPAEIEKRYQELISQYDNEEDYIRTITAAYNWTAGLAKQSIERQILREELEPQVVAYRSGKIIATQHRPGGKLVELDVEGYDKRAKSTADKIAKDIQAEGFGAVYQKAGSYGDRGLSDPLLVTANEFKLSQTEPAVDKEALDAIFAATENQPTELFKTTTFYGVALVEKISAGASPSWEAFLANYPDKSVYENRLGSWYRAIWRGFASQFGVQDVNATQPPPSGGGGSSGGSSGGGGGGSSGGNVGGGGSTGGSPTTCGSATCHAAGVSGKVRDASTGAGLSNVSVNVYTQDSTATCLSHPNDPKCKCGPKSKSTSTGGAGNYSFARVEGTNCFVNCYFSRWHASFSKSGYQPWDTFFNPTNGFNTVINANLAPLITSLTVQAVRLDTGGNINIPIGSETTTYTINKKGEPIDTTVVAPYPTTATVNQGTPMQYVRWVSCSNGPGDYTVGVSGCHVRVNTGRSQTITVGYEPLRLPVACSPANSTAKTGENITFTAEHGDNSNYSWFAYTGTPQSGSGKTFTTSFSFAGNHGVYVSSNNTWMICNVTVTPAVEPVACSPVTHSPILVGHWAFFSASGGNNPYVWTASAGSASPNYVSQNFQVSFNSAGPKTVTVTSAGTSDSCNVQVSSPPPPPPPPAQGSEPSGSVEFDQGERPPIY